MVKNYTKRPVTIQAVQYTGDNIDEIIDFVGEENMFISSFSGIENHYIKTLEGNHFMSKGDYVIRGVEGEFYPCKEHIFKKTYTERA